MKTILLITITFLLSIGISYSQQVPTYEMQPYRDSINRLYWNKHQEVFISISTTKDGNKEKIIDGKKIYGKGLKVGIKSKDKLSGVQATNFSIENSEYKQFTDDLILDKQGDFTLKYFSADNVGNVEKIVEKNFTVDTENPVTNCTITGISLGETNVISLSTKIYINAKDNISGVSKTYYTIDDKKKVFYNGKNIPLNYLSDGNHVLKYYSIDKVANIEEIQTFSFYLDKTAPITSSDILGDRFIVDEQVYFSGRSKLKLTAVDNKAGVKDVKYSIDGGEFKSYTDPFYLPTKQGFHVIKYFALDSTENTTEGDSGDKYKQFKHKVDKIYVDLTGPSLNHSITGDKFYTRDTIFISPNTKIHLRASDKESGLQYISYSIDGEQIENKYTKPFTIKSKSGMHKIEYFGYDNVNNRNIGQFYIFNDTEGPEIKHIFSIISIGKKDELEVYPNYAILFLSAQDKLTGISEIYYSLNGRPDVLYRKYIKGFEKNKINTIKIKAYDKLNNLTTKEYKFFIK